MSLNVSGYYNTQATKQSVAADCDFGKSNPFWQRKDLEVSEKQCKQ